jgi:succinoglycan biosynthesis protein ExoO
MVDVSVIIAAWNAQNTIVRALQSALSQAGVTVEIIVADDASTDATHEIVTNLDDPRIRYVYLPVNRGPAAARNAAIDAAAGKWLAVLDADDMLLPGRLAQLVGAATTHGLDIVTDNMLTEDPAGTRRLFLQEKLDGELQRLSVTDYVARNHMFKKRPSEGYLKPLFATGFLQHHAIRYDTGTRIGEDFLLVAEAMTLGARYGRVRSAGYVYTIGTASVSRRLGRQDAEAMVAADRRFLSRHAARLDRAQRAAWDAHLRSLQDAAGFVAMVDHIKARDPLALARCLWRRPTAIRHFAMPIRARIERLARGASQGAPA